MPFTAAHPVIVLPLARYAKWFSLTGLVAGSIVPDFEYFLRLKITGKYSHTLPGLFFDLPMAMALCFIFHFLVKGPLIDNLPLPLRRRLQDVKTTDWWPYVTTNYGIVLFSCFIGVLSHLLWDGFTHGNGYFVQRLPFMNAMVPFIPFTVHRFFETLFTIFGTLYIGIYIWRLPETEPGTPENAHRFFWYIVTGVALLLFLLRMATGMPAGPGNVVVTLISGLLLGIIIASLYVLYVNRTISSL